jgi:hypothetical protein
MLRRLTLILTLVSVVGLLTAPAVAAARPSAGAQFPINQATDAGNFAGTLTVDRVVNRGGELVAVGTVTGVLTDATTGAQLDSITNHAFTAPVQLQQTTGSCEILDLVLGPLDLELLGLVVTLDTVHLNITAEQGPGNLLGNLLCAVAGLLDGGLNLNALLGSIAGLLNQILAILG